MLSRPPVHSLVPSLEMSIQLAPSVCPWNCLQDTHTHTRAHKPKVYYHCKATCQVTKNVNKLHGSLRLRLSYLTSVWLCKSQTAMFPSLQQEKHTFESGLMASA